jgi:hypothetical protein
VASPQWAGVALFRDGRRAATPSSYQAPEDEVVRVWGLGAATYETHSLIPPGETQVDWYDWGVGVLAYLPDGRLAAAGTRGVRLIEPESGATAWLWRMGPKDDAILAGSHSSGTGPSRTGPSRARRMSSTCRTGRRGLSPCAARA